MTFRQLLTLGTVSATWFVMSAHAQAPYKITAGEFAKIYDPSVGEVKPWYINDHCFVRADDGTWHMFGITHAEPAAPLDEKFLAHATSPSLSAPDWQKHDPVLFYQPGEPWREAHVWAPYIVKHDGVYYMFYCAGDKDHTRYKIHLATSRDLWHWERHPANPLVVDGFDARDPMVIRHHGEWIMYYTANSEPAGGQHVVAAVTSSDLVKWGHKRVVFTHPARGTFGGPTESPFVVERHGKFYLFVCTNNPYNDTAVYVSEDPFAWEPKNQVGKFPAHAAEIAQDPLTMQWFISRAGWGQGGLYLAPLTWGD
ncbi:MAG: hypothetical protein LBK76_00010 [Verrucomicrobiales bacterium]|jgi:hypothetical protein|nr:hypothetical protein [Verrucomicrobiales bacterium]